jgi:microcystin-dependent protein
MANYEATKYDFTGANLTNVDLVNTGLIIPWSDSSIPSGFLECNGQAVSRTTYSALFAVIGTTYGSGNGSTTFNLPDLQDDNAMGKSPTKALASTGGADTVTATGNLSVTVGNTSLSTPTIASHSHTVNERNKSGGGLTPPGNFNNQSTPQPTNKTSGNTGGGGAHNHPGSATFTGNATSVVQPYVTLIYIIKT